MRIGSGLSFTDYVWIRDKPWQPYDKSEGPDFYQTTAKGPEDKGDVYLNPSECVPILTSPSHLLMSTLSSFIVKVIVNRSRLLQCP